MASNELSIEPILVTSKQTIPASVTITGTLDTFGKGVKGTSTKFLTEMPVGSWIYDDSANELRMVNEVLSDTQAYITDAFTSNLSGVSDVIPAKKCNAKAYIFTEAETTGSIGQMVDSTGTLTRAFLYGVSITVSKLGNERTNGADLLKPTIVTSNKLLVQIVY